MIDAPILAIVGPTASGKSALALDLAQRLGAAEIVNGDAMALYEGMDVGTAKTPLGERRGIRHHLLDVLDVRQEASVAAYQREARAACADIRARGSVPILVGGSGLYVRAALDRLDIPPTDAAVRARLEAEYVDGGLAPLRARLMERDPDAAAAILDTNARRTIRALEVIELTGRPFRATMPEREFVSPTVMIGLRVPRARLDARIEDRVQHMWAHGLLAEVGHLLARGLREGRTASRALGYSQAIAAIEGTLSHPQAIEDTVAATRKFARRQVSWFAPDPRITWIDPEDADLLGAADRAYRRSAGQ